MTSSQPAGWTAAELAQAAARGQLDLHYQPLVDLRDHRIAGAEALMRWRHPRLGLLPPGQFLPLAESFGLLVNYRYDTAMIGNVSVISEISKRKKSFAFCAVRPDCC